MKIIITFALCAAVAVLAIDVNNIQDILMNLDPAYETEAKECVEEMKLDTRMLDPEHYKEATLPSVQEQSCFINCFEKKIGLVRSDGSYNESFGVLADDPIDIQERARKGLEERIKRCKDAVGSDACKMSACFHKLPKIFWE